MTFKDKMRGKNYAGFTIKFTPATQKQLDYIDILVIDLNFTRAQRSFHLTKIVGRPINTPDELSLKEASQVISTFIEWKESKKIEDAEVRSYGKPDFLDGNCGPDPEDEEDWS